MVVRRFLGMLALGLWLGLCANARAQDAPASATEPPRPASQAPADVDVSELPISVDRIERQLERPSPITLDVTRPMFRLEIVESRPKWFADIEWLPERDPHLPMPSGTAWNRDYLAMVTPQMARPFGQASGWDLLQLIATSFAEGVAANAIAGRVKGSSKRRASEARAEVDAVIEEWKRQREAAAAAKAPGLDVSDPLTPPSPASPPH
jgi:hypothetical protein